MVYAYIAVNVDPPPLGAALALAVVDRDGPRCSANRNCYHLPSPSIATRSLTYPRRSIRSLEPSSRDGPCLLSCGRWLSAVNIESRRVPWSRPSVRVDCSVQRRSRVASLSQLHPLPSVSESFGVLSTKLAAVDDDTQTASGAGRHGSSPSLLVACAPDVLRSAVRKAQSRFPASLFLDVGGVVIPDNVCACRRSASRSRPRCDVRHVSRRQTRCFVPIRRAR